MSLAGNNSNSGTSGRSSIFETFHTPNFGDETFEVQHLSQPLKTYSRQPQQDDTDVTTQSKPVESAISVQMLNAEGQRHEAEEKEDVMDEDEEVSSIENAETTLWMSCSPGRDLTDDEADEEWGESTSQEMGETNEDREIEDGRGSSDDDDGLPLSKLAGKHFLERGPIDLNAKRLKSKKQPMRDKKAVLKKRSAYSFFYRDTQNAIKSQNPAATFGEISKIVASMWDHLESELKETYSQRAEEYNAQHKDEILSAARLKSKKTKKSSASKSKHRSMDSETQSESQDSLGGSNFKDGVNSKDARDDLGNGDNVDASSNSFSGSNKPKLPKEEKHEKEDKLI